MSCVVRVLNLAMGGLCARRRWCAAAALPPAAPRRAALLCGRPAARTNHCFSLLVTCLTKPRRIRFSASALARNCLVPLLSRITPLLVWMSPRSCSGSTWCASRSNPQSSTLAFRLARAAQQELVSQWVGPQSADPSVEQHLRRDSLLPSDYIAPPACGNPLGTPAPTVRGRS